MRTVTKMDKYLLYDGYHDLHLEALRYEEELGKESLMKGSTRRLYRFPNGYGASVVRGFFTFNNEELMLVKFTQYPRKRLPKKQRIIKKWIKNYGYPDNYSLIGDHIRFSTEEDVQRMLNVILNLKENQEGIPIEELAGWF